MAAYFDKFCRRQVWFLITGVRDQGSSLTQFRYLVLAAV